MKIKFFLILVVVCSLALVAQAQTSRGNVNGTVTDTNGAVITGAVVTLTRTGNLGRNTERSPGTNNFDVNIQKTTRITENTRLQFRAELFNAFNHPQFTQGSVSPFTPVGGTIGSNAAATAGGRFLNPDTPTSDGGGRTVRYQLKFIF